MVFNVGSLSNRIETRGIVCAKTKTGGTGRKKKIDAPLLAFLDGSPHRPCRARLADRSLLLLRHRIRSQREQPPGEV